MMKYHIVATPRSGATAFSLGLAKKYNLSFFNEPFKFSNYFIKVHIGKFAFGGGIPSDADSYVCHHIISQYTMNYGCTVPADHTIIAIDRKDKWQQLKSYICAVELVTKYKSWHNLKYKKEKISAKQRFIQRLFNDWMLFDMFIAANPNVTLMYYEDIIFDDTISKKNTGTNNIKISNEYLLRKYYEAYMLNRQLFK